jgi:hypothetical protein
MTADPDLISEIDAACTTLGESLVRRFSCACCRRVWHLIDDERVWQAIEVAERYAEADATLEELESAEGEVADAIEDRAREEWEAEAEANFGYTPAYCEVAARLYATMAAWYTLSRNMSNPDPDPHLAFTDPRKQSSWFWAAAAVASIERSEALRRIKDHKWDDRTTSNHANATAWLYRIAENREQLQILRRMVNDTESAGRLGGEEPA